MYQHSRTRPTKHILPALQKKRWF